MVRAMVQTAANGSALTGMPAPLLPVCFLFAFCPLVGFLGL